MTFQKIQNDNWMMWEFWDEDEFYGLIVHDRTYLESKQQSNFEKEYYLKIIIPETKCAEGKFPTPEANIELQAIDEALVKLLTVNKVDCKNVNWCTYYGAKRFVYEVNDIAGFEKCVNHWKPLIAPYDVEVSTEPAWTVYNELEPDDYAWLQFNNQQLVQVLAANGSNAEKEHLIEFVVNGRIKNLEELAKKLQTEGGKILELSKDQLEIGFSSTLDSDDINGLSYFVFDCCSELKCKYDGWSAKIVS